MIRKLGTAASLIALLAAGCSLAPAFEKPDVPVPAAFREDVRDTDAKAAAWWQKAAPLEAEHRGQWWEAFADPQLNMLEAQAEAGNEPLKAFAARVAQARADVRVNAPDFLPNISLDGNAVRSSTAGSAPATTYSAGLTASYEPDLFGRLRDADKALALDAEALQATYRSVLLALQADVAQNYFILRALDDERRLLRTTVDIRRKQNDIMQKRFSLGDISEQDKSHAAGDLAQAEAELTALDRQRAKFEHALAVLLGKAPAEFSLSEDPLTGEPPAIPPGVPSALLQRRPDVSAAISSMEAANQRIGAARAAFFPNLMLTASQGVESASLGSLFQWSARSWALGQVGGSLLSLPLLNNGRDKAAVDKAHAAYDESIAAYRQQVLVAFKDVEDALTDQTLLRRQAEQSGTAAAETRRATELTQKRYDLGDVDYFNVVESQRISLAAERAAVQVRGQRYVAAISLIRALGGGWDAPQPAPAAEDEETSKEN